MPFGHKELWRPLAANRGSCDFKDVVAYGHNQLWRPLVAKLRLWVQENDYIICEQPLITFFLESPFLYMKVHNSYGKHCNYIRFLHWYKLSICLLVNSKLHIDSNCKLLKFMASQQLFRSCEYYLSSAFKCTAIAWGLVYVCRTPRNICIVNILRIFRFWKDKKNIVHRTLFLKLIYNFFAHLCKSVGGKYDSHNWSWSARNVGNM